MFTKNIKNTFTASLLNAVSGVLGEAKKKCPADCECDACTAEDEDETNEGYMPTNDMPDAHSRKVAGKLGALLKREREAKEKKEPNGVKTEETVEEGKRGLWDNIHAKQERIKHGSGERMRKPGSEGAPSAQDFKDSQKEEEVSLDGAFEQIDEISKATMGRYINKAKDSIDTASYRQGNREARDLGGTLKSLEKKLTKRHKGIETAVKKLTKEESEQIDELSKGTMGRYINKAATKIGSQGVTAGLKIAADEKSSKNFKDMGKREKGIKLAVNKLTKEEQDFIDSLNADTLDEARGRPKKAGAKDFTIHPKTKEKLMHSNPEHMAKIEKLQKHGILQKPKTEANQHIIQQLQRAKLSMRGGETINFTHGDPHHVAGHHAATLLTKYAGMKPDEKETFQKKIGHSHANLKSEL